jgi:hypothetical protein
VADCRRLIYLLQAWLPAAQSFPAVRMVWAYRSTFQMDAARAGLWSQSVSIAVQATTHLGVK